MPEHYEYTDQGVERRFNELVTGQARYIETGHRPARRIKRSAVTWKHAHSRKTKEGKTFWYCTMGIGGVVAVGTMVGFASLAWPAVFAGIGVAGVVWYGKKKLSAFVIKKTVIKKLKDMEKIEADYLKGVNQGQIQRQISGGINLDVSKVANNAHKLATVAFQAEAILTLLVNETGRLFKKDKEYKKAFGQGPYLNIWNDAMKAARNGFITINNVQQDVKVGTSVSGKWMKFGYKQKGSKDPNVARIKLAVILRRLRLMVRYLDDYFDVLKDRLEEEARKLNLLEEQIQLSTLVKNIISGGPHHSGCEEGKCYGPEQRDLVKVAKSNITKDQWKAIVDDTQIATSKIGGGSTPNAVLQKYKKRYDQDEANTQQEMREMGGEFLADMALEGATSGGGEVAELGMEALSELGAEAASGGAGFILGAVVGEVIKSFRVNKPAYKNAKGVRLAAHKATVDARFIGDEIDKYAKSTKSNGLERMLTKIHNHYFRRIDERLKKLNELGTDLKFRNEFTCNDALALVRYYLKVYHYIDKAYVNLLFINRVIECLEGKINKHFKNAVKW